MKKPRKLKLFGSGLNKSQRSTLELWQEHLAALNRASQRNEHGFSENTHPISEQTVESSRPRFDA